MLRHWALIATAAAVLVAAPAALAQPAQTITATGTGEAKVVPKDPHNNASIAAAVDKAHVAAIGSAFSEAHEYALDYANQAGMTLGSVVSVTDVSPNVFYGPGQTEGAFGPDRFCGTERVPVFKKVNGKRKLLRFKKEHRCLVPGFAYSTLSVTYAASSG